MGALGAPHPREPRVPLGLLPAWAGTAAPTANAGARRATAGGGHKAATPERQWHRAVKSHPTAPCTCTETWGSDSPCAPTARPSTGSHPGSSSQGCRHTAPAPRARSKISAITILISTSNDSDDEDNKEEKAPKPSALGGQARPQGQRGARPGHRAGTGQRGPPASGLRASRAAGRARVPPRAPPNAPKPPDRRAGRGGRSPAPRRQPRRPAAAGRAGRQPAGSALGVFRSAAGERMEPGPRGWLVCWPGVC